MIKQNSELIKEQVLVSACCLGLCCRYHGRQSVIKVKLRKLREKYYLVPICPEQLGGLPTPRPSARWSKGKLIFGRSSRENCWILQQSFLLPNKDKGDAYSFFHKGAKETLSIARNLNITKAYFLKGSPSCDPHSGVCAIYLKENGVKVCAL